MILINIFIAIILAHFYQLPEVQDIADFVGDSLKLSQEAAKTNADIIVFAGVHFMAETAKILSPEKKVILPDLNAGCSLADSAPPEEFAKFKAKYPDHIVISYVNTTAKIKTMSDIICTSSNALKIIESLPEDQKIIFAPDKNLGDYIRKLTGRDMVIWDGHCHVHNSFTIEAYENLKAEHPNAVLIAHPESPKKILIQAEYVGSTSGLLKYTDESDANEFIIATEEGIIHKMKEKNPQKKYYSLFGKCDCGYCEYMKEITLEKLYLSLKYELPEINLDETIRKKAYLPIKKMLDISEKLGI
ncbi:MAG TPA: quinolinate synthase NadA [Bacteroidales bacterium]|nr:quinolinate synthase NadA [Bacteroidales bacterium]